MGSVGEEVEIGAALADVWERYFDPRGWPGWVDGFGSVQRADGYPEVSGELRWRSTPAGRGEVHERVLEHEPRRRHRISFADSYATGELLTTFEIVSGREADAASTRVRQKARYRLRRWGPLRPLVDLLFVRSQVRGSLARSLQRLRLELEEPAGSDARG